MAKNQQTKKPNDKYDYVLSWIRESREARTKQNAFVDRSIMAYEGRPSKNRYARTIKGYAESVQKNDSDKAQAILESYKDIPEKSSMVVRNAVETIVSMTMGGVGQYEFGPYDPDLKKDHTITDKLSSFCKHWYVTQKIDAVVPRLIRASVLSGVSYLHLNRKESSTHVTILDSSQMITDPKRFKTNYERYIGHAQRESFKVLKSNITKAPGGGYILKTINEAQVYVDQIKNAMNSVLAGNQITGLDNAYLRDDLDIFYKNITADCQEAKKKDSSYSYDGDDVEITYLYDLMNNMEFQVVNRKYIISAKPKKLSRSIKCTYYDSNDNKKEKSKKVEIDHPYVELPYTETYWDRYPITPLFYVLDDYDDLCAMESVLYHNLSIMAPITFVGQSSDVEKVSRVASVAGEVIEGLPQTFGTLGKSHDVTPVITAIQRYEEKIKRVMSAVDPFELQSMIGDRATAKEVVSVSGSVSQGMNPFIANIETAMATLGEKAMKMEIIYGKDTYSFTHNGEYAELTSDEIAGEYEVRAKLASSIKLEQESNARRAQELLVGLSGSEAIDPKNFYGTMIPISMSGLVSKEEAKAMVLPKYQPLPDEVIARIRKQEEERAKRDAIDRMDLSALDTKDLQDAIVNMSNVESDPLAQYAPMDVVQPVMPTQVPVDPAAAPVDPLANQMSLSGFPQQVPTSTPETGGEVFNDPTGEGLIL